MAIPKRTWLIGASLVAVIAVALVVVLTRSDGCAFRDADVDIALYSTVGADADQIHELSDLVDDIEQVEGVERAFFRSPQEALEQFESIHADSEAIQDALPPGGYTPDDFKASIRVVVADGFRPEEIADRLPDPPAVDELIVSPTDGERRLAEIMAPSVAEEGAICLSD